MTENASNGSTAAVLQARNLVKRYGNVTALDGADFELLPGEVLAVIGDNGAGKSTLIKALSGALVPDEGEIFLDGEQVRFNSPLDARRHGIETVYQDLAVAPAMTIADNLFLGREGAGKLEMVPINERTFMLKDVDYFKIKIIEEQGLVSAAEGMWSDGRTQLFEKTK